MSGQWINAANVVKLLPDKDNTTEEGLHKVLATLAGRAITGTVKQCPKVISLFQYAISKDSLVAWNLLAALYRHTAFSQAKTVLEDDEADDVAQEVMLSLWAKRSKFTPESNLGGWVRVAARNAAIDAMRSRKAHAELGVPDGEEEQVEEVDTEYTPDEWAHSEPVDLDSPDEMLIAEQTLGILAAAFKELPEQSQDVMEMVASGSGYDAIAERLGISNDSVRQVVIRSRQFLNERLAYANKV